MSKSGRMVFLVMLVFGTVVDPMLGQEKSTTTPASGRTETELSKTVVFITVLAKAPEETSTIGNRDGKGKGTEKPVTVQGTGLLISMPDSRLGKDNGFGYLVTNRHVADAIEQDDKGNCTPLQIEQTYVTLNLRSPVNGHRQHDIQLPSVPGARWYFPTDEAIDLAVMPFAPNPRVYDARTISTQLLLTSGSIVNDDIVPGDKVLTTGFFYQYAGLHQIQPILREGVLAMLPDGPMTTTTCKSGRLYLADVHVTPGNSDSPIFIIPGLGLGASASLGGIPSTFGLLGIVSGYMSETEDLELRASSTWKGSLNANSGISVVVPAQQLYDLLNSPEMQQQRDELLSGRTRPSS